MAAHGAKRLRLPQARCGVDDQIVAVPPRVPWRSDCRAPIVGRGVSAVRRRASGSRSEGMFRASRLGCASAFWRLLTISVLLGCAGTASAAFTVTDFAVDPAHATLGDPHEVASPSFANFQLTIYGTFNTSKCYQVKIERDGGAPCGSANSSGTDTANVFADHLVADISPNASADFKAANDWRIEIKERSAGCSGGSTTGNFP